MLKKLVSLLFILAFAASLASCGSRHIEGVPDDFSFSIVWGVNGISSFDSKTGKLVKTSDATDVSKYTAYVELTDEEMKAVYRWLCLEIDLTAYPYNYDPFNAPDATNKIASSPNQTIVISVSANGKTKTVRCDGIAIAGLLACYDDASRAFLTAEISVVELLTSHPAWRAFPDYEFYYD